MKTSLAWKQRIPVSKLPRLFLSVVSFLTSVFMMACGTPFLKRTEASRILSYPEESYFSEIKQITFGGISGKPFWSPSGGWIAFQHHGPGLLNETQKCSQIYMMKKDGSDPQRISDGKGTSTSPFFLPNQPRVLFSTTTPLYPACTPAQGNFIPLLPTYQIYSVKMNPQDRDPLPVEPGAPRAYNAETTVCQDGSIVFTSDRDGDLNLYLGRLDRFGTLQNVKKIVRTGTGPNKGPIEGPGKGYDGGADFSPDCKQITWNASRHRPGIETRESRSVARLTSHETS